MTGTMTLVDPAGRTVKYTVKSQAEETYTIELTLGGKQLVLSVPCSEEGPPTFYDVMEQLIEDVVFFIEEVGPERGVLCKYMDGATDQEVEEEYRQLEEKALGLEQWLGANFEEAILDGVEGLIRRILSLGLAAA